MTFKLSFNDYYSQDISNKIKAVKRRKAEKGEFIAGFAPYGYKKDPNNKNHLVISEETAPTVRRIFNLYLEGSGTLKITRMLNEENVPPPAKYIKSKRYEKCGFKWTKAGIYRLLTSEVYIGTVVGRKSYKKNHKVKNRIITPLNERIYVEDKHEPIIDKKQFEMVQRKLQNAGKWRERKNDHPLKEFIYCGMCGAKATMKVHKRQVKSGEIHEHKYFICGRKSENYHNCENGRISGSIITPIVQEEIKKECSKIIFSKGDIASLYEQAKQSSNNKKSILSFELAKVEKEVQQIEKKIEQIYTDKLEGMIKPEDFTKFYNSHQEKKENLFTKRKNLKRELEETNNQKIINYEEIEKIAKECLEMEELDKDLLRKLIDRIEYTKGKKIRIKYRFMEYK